MNNLLRLDLARIALLNNLTCIDYWYIRGAIKKFRNSADKVRKGWVVFVCRWGYGLGFIGTNWCKFRPTATFQSRAKSIRRTLYSLRLRWSSKIEQRANIKLCVKPKRTAAEAILTLRKDLKVMKSIMVVFIDIHITVNSFHRARLSMRPSNEATEVGHFAVSGVTETG